MTTPIPDGVYHISSNLFPNTFIDLTEGLPYGAVTAWVASSSTNLHWIVKNIGNNQITLENVTARGYYIGVTYLARGTPALGTPSPVYWTVRQAASGVYNLESDGLFLSQRAGGENASIFLGPLIEGTLPSSRQQWKFTRIN